MSTPSFPPSTALAWTSCSVGCLDSFRSSHTCCHYPLRHPGKRCIRSDVKSKQFETFVWLLHFVVFLLLMSLTILPLSGSLYLITFPFFTVSFLDLSSLYHRQATRTVAASLRCPQATCRCLFSQQHLLVCTIVVFWPPLIKNDFGNDFRGSVASVVTAHVSLIPYYGPLCIGWLLLDSVVAESSFLSTRMFCQSWFVCFFSSSPFLWLHLPRLPCCFDCFFSGLKLYYMLGASLRNFGTCMYS